MYDKDYVQYSKKVTKFGMILIGITFALCIGIIAFTGQPAKNIEAIVSLYTTFATVLGVTIGAYQGNSVLEKYSKAKYQQDNLSTILLSDEEMENESSNG